MYFIYGLKNDQYLLLMNLFGTLNYQCHVHNVACNMTLWIANEQFFTDILLFIWSSICFFSYMLPYLPLCGYLKWIYIWSITKKQQIITYDWTLNTIKSWWTFTFIVTIVVKTSAISTNIWSLLTFIDIHVTEYTMITWKYFHS